MANGLFNRTILVTRPRDQAQELQFLLEKEGAKTLVQPAITITPPKNWDDVDDALRAIDNQEVDWALFSSANGVRFIVERIVEKLRLSSSESFKDVSEYFAQKNVRLATVGASTTKVAQEFGLSISLEPKRYDAEGLIDALTERLPNMRGVRFLSFRASRGRKALSEELTSRGARVREVEAYQSVDATTPDADVVNALREGKIDFATVMSSATAKSIARMFGDLTKKTRWIALSPLTASALESCGIKADSVAEQATIESLVASIISLNASPSVVSK